MTSVSFCVIKGAQNKAIKAVGVDQDITERKQAENALQESEEKYRRLVEGLKSEYFFYRHDTDGVFTYVSPSITSVIGHSPEDFCVHFSTFLTDSPINQNVERYTAQSLQGIQQPFYEVEIRHKDGSIHRLELLECPVISTDGKVLAVDGIARDITERKRAENDLQQSFNALQDSLTGAVQAMATVVESRDPYTAGHQRRVAELANAIASEMRLPIHQMDGVRMAAVIHDLGKMAVPAEILSKPTKLKKYEFELIKEHPQAGYEILKDIAFPWPIARIILEHHEKVDGSGYPNGSVGENILLESKILAVADVVEAMASHRPYRPALGIEAALEEIDRNKGVLYDPDVVSACLTLFRERRFTFK